MYYVESGDARMFCSRRRTAFVEARQLARENGESRWRDALGLEPDIVFRRVGKRAVVCRCTPESRLMRAIFGEGHPDDCSI